MMCDVDDYLTRTTSEARAVLYHDGEGNAVLNKAKAWIEQKCGRAEGSDQSLTTENNNASMTTWTLRSVDPGRPISKKSGLPHPEEVSR